MSEDKNTIDELFNDKAPKMDAKQQTVVIPDKATIDKLKQIKNDKLVSHSIIRK